MSQFRISNHCQKCSKNYNNRVTHSFRCPHRLYISDTRYTSQFLFDLLCISHMLHCLYIVSYITRFAHFLKDNFAFSKLAIISSWSIQHYNKKTKNLKKCHFPYVPFLESEILLKSNNTLWIVYDFRGIHHRKWYEIFYISFKSKKSHVSFS